MTVGLVVGVVGLLAGYMILFMTTIVASDVEENLKTGTSSGLASFAFLLLIYSHLFLIYYCFLGGWRLFV
jgi:hypothetical protein